MCWLVNRLYISVVTIQTDFRVYCFAQSLCFPAAGVFNPQPAGEFCAAREGYFIKYTNVFKRK